MLSFFHSLHPDLTTGSLVLFFSASIILGMSKAGLSGFGLTAVPLMALIFGAKESTGVILPMLIAADIIAVIYYRSHAVWKYIFMVLPWTIAGILVALITGKLINDEQFRLLLISLVWIMVILMILNDLRKKDDTRIPDNHWFASLMGFTGGFSTMIGNAAGPVFIFYFLSMRLPKKEFIGTSAWLYFIMNTGKLPLQILVWKNITMTTIIPSLIGIPAVVAGIFLGIRIVKLFPEKAYRYFVIITTLATSVLLFI